LREPSIMGAGLLDGTVGGGKFLSPEAPKWFRRNTSLGRIPAWDPEGKAGVWEIA
jgi:hypothetical protein